MCILLKNDANTTITTKLDVTWAFDSGDGSANNPDGANNRVSSSGSIVQVGLLGSLMALAGAAVAL